MTHQDLTAIRKAEHRRRIRAIDAKHNALKAYANNPTIDPADIRRVPTFIAG